MSIRFQTENQHQRGIPAENPIHNFMLWSGECQAKYVIPTSFCQLIAIILKSRVTEKQTMEKFRAWRIKHLKQPKGD